MRSLYSVYDVVHYVKQSLDQDFNLHSLYIKGEISNFTNHRSGHWYFTLKDSKAKLNCVMFSSYARRCPFILKEGMKVLVCGDITMYEASGSIQLYVTNVQMDGIGELFLQLEQNKKRLNSLGYFDPKYKKAIPLFPESIGVICAKSAAATQDVLTTIQRRWPICDVTMYHSLVQGVNAANDLIHNLKLADQNNHDIILLVRGGGAIEDLWCFNDENLAITIFQMKTCIITGVGHESDTTLVDYVSDARAPTPTAAAELATPSIDNIKNILNKYQQQLNTLMKQRLNNAHILLNQIKNHRFILNPLEYIKEKQMTLIMHEKTIYHVLDKYQQDKQQYDMYKKQLINLGTSLLDKLKTNNEVNKQHLIQSMSLYYAKQEQKYAMMISLLEAYSPLNSLKRGYSITYQNNKLIKNIDDVVVNETLNIQIMDGKIEALVLNKEKKDGK